MNAIINGISLNLQRSGPSLHDCPTVPEGEEADYVFVTNMSKDNYESDCLDPTLCYLGEAHHADPKTLEYLKKLGDYGIYYHKDRQGVNLKAECERLATLCHAMLGMI